MAAEGRGDRRRHPDPSPLTAVCVSTEVTCGPRTSQSESQSRQPRTRRPRRSPRIRVPANTREAARWRPSGPHRNRRTRPPCPLSGLDKRVSDAPNFVDCRRRLPVELAQNQPGRCRPSLTAAGLARVNFQGRTMQLYNCKSEEEQTNWAIKHLRRGGRIHDIALWLGGVDQPHADSRWCKVIAACGR